MIHMLAIRVFFFFLFCFVLFCFSFVFFFFFTSFGWCWTRGKLREEAGGQRFLVLRPKPAETPLTNWLVTVTAETDLKDLPQ